MKPKTWSLIILLVCLLYYPAQAQQGIQSGISFGFANVNGIKLHYAKTGHGKKLILLVHGFPEFWYEYKDVLAAYSNSNEYTVVAPDLRGYNLSSKPDSVGSYKVKFIVEDLRQLALSFKVKKFTLVAHDWGGVIAWWFAIIHPENLNKLVIIDAPHPALFAKALANDTAQQKASSYISFFQSPQAEKALSANNYAALVNTVLSKGFKDGTFTEADKQAYLTAWAQPGALTGGLNYYRALKLGYGLNSDTYKVSVPTLVIWGENDTALLLSNLKGLDQYVPDLTIKTIPGTSHWVIHERPALVIGYLKDFIQ